MLFLSMFFTLLTVFFSVSLQSVKAITLENAAKEAVLELQKNGLDREGRFEMLITMTNIHSGKYDKDARIIKSALFSTLQAKFPRAKIILEEESLVGVSFKAILVKGTYQPKEEQIIINLNAIDQTTGQMIARSEVYYDVKRKGNEDLIAVLPLEAAHLEKPVLKTFTKIFRSALTKTGVFNLVNSDAIDQADADEIQEQYGCTREECSAIVAESLNATNVITTQYNMVTEGIYFLTGSLKNIKSGKTIKEEAIRHDGDLSTLEDSLKTLACMLAGTCSDGEKEAVVVSQTDLKAPETGGELVQTVSEEGDQPIEAPPEIEEDDGWPWWTWVIGGAVALGLVAAAGGGGDSGGSSSSGGSSGGGSDSDCPADECGSAEITW